MMQLMRADGVYLGYYHPEHVDLDTLRKYRIEGASGVYVNAADVKTALGEEAWKVLASHETSYLVEENLVVNSPEKYNRKKPGLLEHPQHAGIWKITAYCRGGVVKRWLYEDLESYLTWLRRHRRHYVGYEVKGYHRIGKEWVEDTVST